MMMPYFAVTSQKLQEEYNVHSYPTVILFVDGRPTHEWVMNYDLDDYRLHLNRTLLAQQSKAGSPVALKKQ